MYGIAAILSFVAALILQLFSIRKGVWDTHTMEVIGFLALSIHIVTGWLPVTCSLRRNQQ